MYYCIEYVYVSSYRQEVQRQRWFTFLAVNKVDCDKGGKYVGQVDNYGFLYLFGSVGIIRQFEDFRRVIYDDVYFGELLYYL